jgi:serine phosphatase RsbU (regulator of sigma subunit)
MSDAERSEIERRQHEQSLLLGDEFQVPVEEDGEVVGHVKACVASRDVLKEILRGSVRDEGEVPFAIDREGTLYTADDEGLAVVEELAIEASEEGGRWQATGPAADDWVVATSEETGSGLTFGIARPIRQSLAEVRRPAARNFAYGLGLIVLGLVGIQPLSRRMTRQLDTVTRGAERIARGDLQTRLPVESKSELGELSSAFNHMAAELSVHQERLVREESRRKEHELQERLLLAEFRRKSDELEEARRFQLSLLPKEMPDHPGLDLAVAMTTATEVGGDFYDYRQGDDGSLTLAVGDATGHGARAGTMVTVIKSLFSAWSAASGDGGAARFLEDANRAIKRMELGRMAMALVLARFDGHRLTLASAGMPPALVHRADPGGGEGRVEEVVLSGMPLGGLDFAYCEHEIDLAPGDTVLLLSDGLCELPDAAGDPMGYAAVRDLFRQAAGQGHECLDPCSFRKYRRGRA